MRLDHRCLAATGALLLAFAAPQPAPAAGPAEQLGHRIDRVFGALDAPDLKGPDKAPDRRAVVRRMAEETLDYAETARRALGRHWEARTADERAEFVRLFTELIERAYLSKLDLYDGENVRVLSERVEGDEAAVQTKVVTREGSEIPVNFRMLRHPQDDRWRVWDVVIEGVSLVANYRAQFNRIINGSSYNELVRRLRAKDSAATGT